MSIPVVSLPTTKALRDYLHIRLCEHDHLDPAQTPLFQSLLHRRERLCGAVYHIEGPRHLRTSAIWAGEEHRILFYDSSGSRYAEVQLSESPEPRELSVDPESP